jgi:predicted NBD/HSP70 family sugar kinase
MSIVPESKCKLSQQVKRSWILETIRDRKLISRKDLAKITGLSTPVVSRLTDELINERFIEEIGKGTNSSSGRRPVWLSLSKTSKFLIGIDVGAYETKAVLTNLNSEVLWQIAHLTPRDQDGRGMIEYFKRIIKELIAGGRVNQNDLQGIIFALSGVVNSDKGVAVQCCNEPSLSGLQISHPITDAFQVPVVLTNTAGVWAVSECERARTDQKNMDFLVVLTGYGVGLVPLIDGKAPVGRNPKAKVDFGHITYDPAGPMCNCGSQGCVEACASGWAIERDARRNPSDQLLGLAGGKVEAITAKEVFDAAIRGDRNSFGIIRQAGEILGRNLAHFVQYYMPERVIFAGGLVTKSSLYLDAVTAEISRWMPAERFSQFKIQVTSLDKFAGAIGATHLLAHEVLHAPVEDMVRITW